MTYIYSIHQLLSIEDKNIIFDEKLLLPTVKIKDTTYRQLSGKLSYTPTCCEKYGVQNNNNTVIKYGFKTIRLLLGNINFSPLLLQLKKQRFLCETCGETFIAHTSIVYTTAICSYESKYLNVSLRWHMFIFGISLH